MTPTTDLHRSDLLDHLTAARWFGGKGRRAELTGVTTLADLQPAGRLPLVRVEVAEISYPEGRELYQLLHAYYPDAQPDLARASIGVVEDPEHGTLHRYDGAQDPAALAVLLQRLIDGDRVESEDAEVTFRPSRTGVLSSELVGTVYGGQQSNTSIMYGETAMVKLFRRLELGRNLDIEVHDQLSRAGITDVAQLYGWIEASWTHRGERLAADLGMAVEKLSSATDGWELALSTIGADPGSFTADAEALGTSLAHIHVALRDAFPTADRPGADVADVMSARLQAAVAVAPALTPYLDGLLAAFDELRRTTVSGQRVHGDFHLGQTLSTPDGWKIIDFEGEPAKTMAERLAPDSPVRDVAGMLRSFAYAAASRPGPGALAWAEASRAAFLAGYEGVLGPIAPAVLSAYEADKAVYEVVYETRNRPDWIHIPLAAVVQIAGAAPAPTSVNTTPQTTAGEDIP